MLSSLDGGQSRGAEDDDYDAIFLRLLEDEESYNRRQGNRDGVLGNSRALSTFRGVSRGDGVPPERVAITHSEHALICQKDLCRNDDKQRPPSRHLACDERFARSADPRAPSDDTGSASTHHEAALPDWIRREIYVRDGELVILRDRLERQQQELIALRNAQAAGLVESRRTRASSQISYTDRVGTNGHSSTEAESGTENVFIERLTAEVERLRARLAFREREIAELRELLAGPSPPKRANSAVRKTLADRARIVAPARSRAKRAGIFFNEHLLLLHEQDSGDSQRPSASEPPKVSDLSSAAPSVHPCDPSITPKTKESGMYSKSAPVRFRDSIEFRDRASIVAVLAACADLWHELFQRWSVANAEMYPPQSDALFAQQALMLLNAETDLRLCLVPIQHAILTSYARWRRSPDAMYILGQDTHLLAALTILDGLVEHCQLVRDYFVDVCSSQKTAIVEDGFQANGLMLEHIMDMVIGSDLWTFWQTRPSSTVAFFRILRNLFQTWCQRLRNAPGRQGPSDVIRAKMLALIRAPALAHLFERFHSDSVSLLEIASAALSSAFAVENCITIHQIEDPQDAPPLGWQEAALQTSLPARALGLLRAIPITQIAAVLSLIEPLFLGPHADYIRRQWALHSCPEDRIQAVENLVDALERLLGHVQGLDSLETELPIHLLALDRRELALEASPQPRAFFRALMRLRLVESLPAPTEMYPPVSLSLSGAPYLGTRGEIHGCMIRCLAVLYRCTQSSSIGFHTPTQTARPTSGANKENRAVPVAASTGTDQQQNSKEDYLIHPDELRPALRARLRILLRGLRRGARLVQRRSAPGISAASATSSCRVVHGDDMSVTRRAVALVPLTNELWRWLHSGNEAVTTT
ncbi:hypothetical protein CCYA_CCYA14G3680 [Cyanidiococcus yangmingshanensis]|nr:hypothetical protein CCYA_CCYA14G3680 [Cyanidiococcus yangmingshanensis]